MLGPDRRPPAASRVGILTVARSWAPRSKPSYHHRRGWDASRRHSGSVAVCPPGPSHSSEKPLPVDGLETTRPITFRSRARQTKLGHPCSSRLSYKGHAGEGRCRLGKTRRHVKCNFYSDFIYKSREFALRKLVTMSVALEHAFIHKYISLSGAATADASDQRSARSAPPARGQQRDPATAGLPCGSGVLP